MLKKSVAALIVFICIGLLSFRCSFGEITGHNNGGRRLVTDDSMFESNGVEVYDIDHPLEECLGRIPVVCKYATTPQEHDVVSTTAYEAVTAVNKAGELSSKRAMDLYEHSLRLAPRHPEVLYKFALFLEQQGDFIRANHMFLMAYHFGKSRDALMGYQRTLPQIIAERDRIFANIEEKAKQLQTIPRESLPMRRAKKEMRFKHVYNTNALEGNTISLVETRFIIETRRVDGVRASVNEVMEVISINDALDFIVRLVNRTDGYGLVVNSDTINEIHRIVLGRVDINYGGIYRDMDVSVADHVAPDYQLVREMMGGLNDWFNSSHFLNLHPIERAALAHYQLVWVHPYVDGNGRTSRLLMNMILMHAGYPEIIIELEDRVNYYETLRAAHPKHGGDTMPFIFFIAHALEKTLDSYLTQVVPKRTPIILPNYNDEGGELTLADLTAISVGEHDEL